MRKLLVVACLLIASATARAETFSFVIDGQAIHIGIASGCRDISCVTIDVPGYYSSGDEQMDEQRPSRRHVSKHREPKRKSKAAAKPAPVPTPAPTEAAKSEAGATPAAAAPVTRSVGPTQMSEPKAAAAPAAEPVTESTKAGEESASQADEPKEATQEPRQEAPQEARQEPRQEARREQKQTVVAALPPSKPQSETPPTASPMGMWSGRDGQLKVEACGAYLCGYAGGGKHAGKMVLINMRQTKDNHWTGRVRDFQSGGVYSASMWMRGANSLRIQGCAFGGMICGGRTLSRVQ